MLEELQRRNYSSTTIRAYLFAVKDFATYFGKRPDLLRQEHLRQYQLHLLNERKLTVDTIVGRIAALPLGRHGWLMALCFAAFGAASACLFAALVAQISSVVLRK